MPEMLFNFVEIDMMSEYGLSGSHYARQPHVNDRIVYPSGYKRREGTYVEAYAQGIGSSRQPRKAI